MRGDKLYKLDRQGRQLAVFGSVLTGKPGSIGAVGPLDARISPDYTSPACGVAPKLVIAGGNEPDWGPADPGAAAAARSR